MQKLLQTVCVLRVTNWLACQVHGPCVLEKRFCAVATRVEEGKPDKSSATAIEVSSQACLSENSEATTIKEPNQMGTGVVKVE
ncbi:uncharacterized protein SPSK_06801 [Sporothrix schenckii 1099-18]|uniref:Uncharacterized protein n=1 Tax=Sporothrix schenckii 1099-18 TaxID=1397361 RepID=A0A0F2MLU0_SPOSC|nr:uncharacterized protein SPSK_06801 [Sporothrix schenckii 1099-18]KJR89151.1 hypothetical protein SPSK_06801 [Sporothrix schenckii 1099-18]